MITQNTNCLDISLLSQFLDDELAQPEAGEARRHLETCGECRARLERLGQAGQWVRRNLFPPAPGQTTQAASAVCPSPDVVAAYAQRLLPQAEHSHVEEHLQACPHCVHEVLQASRMMAVLTATKNVAVPVALKERAAAQWGTTMPQPDTVPLTRLVVRAAQRGLELLEQYLAPPFVNLQHALIPMPAYRAGDIAAPLDLTLQAGRGEIRATAFPEGDGISLKVTLVGADQTALAGQRVFLRQDGRAIFSAKTDQQGVLRTPHLTPGVYEVACTGVDGTFLLELLA